MPSSRLLDDAIPQYLTRDSAPVSAPPFSILIWFKSDSIALYQTLFWLGDKDTSNNQWRLFAAGGDTGDPLWWHAEDGGSDQAKSTSGYSANQWHMAVGVEASSTSRAVYLDGGNKGTNTTDLSPANADRIRLGYAGDTTPDNPTSAKIAVAAVYNMALSDADVIALWNGGDGVLPTSVQSGNLVSWWLGGDENDNDQKASNDLTAIGSPTWDSGDFPIAIGVVNRIPIIDHHNRMMAMMGD